MSFQFYLMMLLLFPFWGCAASYGAFQSVCVQGVHVLVSDIPPDEKGETYSSAFLFRFTRKIEILLPCDYAAV